MEKEICSRDLIGVTNIEEEDPKTNVYQVILLAYILLGIKRIWKSTKYLKMILTARVGAAKVSFTL